MQRPRLSYTRCLPPTDGVAVGSIGRVNCLDFSRTIANDALTLTLFGHRMAYAVMLMMVDTTSLALQSHAVRRHTRRFGWRTLSPGYGDLSTTRRTRESR